MQIGRQMVTTGKRFTPKEIERYIDAVTTDEIKRVATKYLWDKDVSDLFPAVLRCPDEREVLGTWYR